MVPLHEIRQRRPAHEQAWREWLANPENLSVRPARWQEQYLAGLDFDADYARILLVDEIGRFERTGRAAGIYRDLADRARRVLPLSPRDREGVALILTREEWHLLRSEMSPAEMERNFGHEGAVPRFYGIRLMIV